MKTEVIVLHLKWITEEVTEIVHMVTVKDEPPVLVWKNNYDELQVTVINMLHTLRLHLPMGEEKRGNLELVVETAARLKAEPRHDLLRNRLVASCFFEASALQ